MNKLLLLFMINASANLLAMQAKSSDFIPGKAKIEPADSVCPFSQAEKCKKAKLQHDNDFCDECVKQTACILCCVPRTLHFLYGVCTANA